MAVSAIVGAVSGFVHRTTVDVGGLGVPVGLVAALLAVAGLVLAARVVGGSRGAVLLVAAAFTLPVLALSQFRPEGDLVVAEDVWGLTLLGGSALAITVGVTVPVRAYSGTPGGANGDAASPTNDASARGAVTEPSTRPTASDESGPPVTDTAVVSSATQSADGSSTPSRRGWWAGVGVVLTLLILGGGYLAAYSYAGTTVPVGTTVLGIDIGRQTQEQAEQTLRRDLPPIADAPVTLLVGSDTYSITPSESGLNVDVPATVRAAGVGASDPFRLIESIVRGGGPVDPVVVVDTDALRATVDEIADQADRETVEGAVAFVDGAVEATLPESGRVVDRRASADAVTDAYLVRSAPVRLPFEVLAPVVTASEVERAVQEFAEPAMSGPVAVESSLASRALSTAVLGDVLSMPADDEGVLAPVMDADALMEASGELLADLGEPATNASVVIRNGQPTVIPSAPGQQVDTATYTDDVFAALTETGDARVVTLPLVPKPAEFTTDDARASGVRQVIAEFTTFYPHADYRNVNIGRAAELANNTFLRPGDVFSMNGVVGERTAARGFTSGFIIENGRFAEALGGGVSQFATTLFNAGHFAGFEDVEHHPHTLFIDRYPPGREATVFWGSWDLRFGNNTPYGAVVQSFINPSRPGSNGSVTVRIWSTPYWDVTSVTGNRFNFRPFERKVISGDGCVPSSGSQGFDIVVTRTLSREGVVREREELFTRYQPTPEVVCTG